ncbi:hypothetical protein AVEN_213445-1 [Araneus ventricosus]|uniref:Transposase Tc1-like domain-containing protein n=1 Tax=Araneus ventricosus TaxID=182803 RepID=A0A4Y2JX97_ARAVE|nr:hypothetical protein AVEN_213445-1 [Araneus ventricosus]
MSNHQRLDDGMRYELWGGWEAGQSQVQITEFNLNAPASCATYGKQFQDTASIERKPGQGRPRATTATEDRYLSTVVRRNRVLFSASPDLYAATGTRVSRVTVKRLLARQGCLQEDVLPTLRTGSPFLSMIQRA